MFGTGLPVSMNTTKTHYMSDIRNVLQADRFSFMMMTAANKETKQL
jgi:hypothetical protein